MQVVGVAFLHLEKSSGGFGYILLLTDHFTRYTQTFPTKNKAAKTATNHIYNYFILRFGIPFKILHDRGAEFENGLFKVLSNILGIRTCASSHMTLEHMASQKGVMSGPCLGILELGDKGLVRNWPH